MNVVRAVQLYIEKALKAVDGMKVLLLDAETTGVVSVCFSQSQILQKEVYLFEKISQQGRQLLGHLKAVCFLRPTPENLDMLVEELKDPKYGEYHMFFTNTVDPNMLEALAAADEHEVIQQVQEFYADFFAINTDLFTLNLPNVLSPAQDNFRGVLHRVADGVCAMLLALKKRPVMRFSSRSQLCQKLAAEVDRRITADRGLYHFGNTGSHSLLLLVDRKDDAVTPLLTQWTYQAMVHDFLGLDNNRLDLKHVKGIKPDMREVVLSAQQDPFFKENAFANFGDLGDSIKELVDSYQAKTQSNKNIESIEDIKRFVEEFPEFQKMAGNVTKHVTIMGELNRMVSQNQMLEVSELEQSIANNYDFSTHFKAVKEMMQQPEIMPDTCLRLCVLLCLRYESQAQQIVPELLQTLQRDPLNLPQSQVASIRAVTQFCGESSRTPADLFDDKGGKKYFKNVTRSLGLQGVQNVYTEHKPLLKKLLDQVFAGKLPEETFPYANIDGRVDHKHTAQSPPKEVIVFFVGGCTFEEALCIHQFNNQHKQAVESSASAAGTARGPKVSIVLGGTTIHNSKSFMRDLQKLQELS